MKKLLENLLEQDIFKPPTEEELEQRKIEVFVREYNGKQNPDGSYDFDRSFDKDDLKLVIKNGKFIIKFGKVKGGFYCSDNNLTSLEGAPKYVGGSFDCFDNDLTTLEGAPERVGRDFKCSYNNLTSLKGAPERVEGYFNCSDNQLTSLEGAPKYVGWDFYCRRNKKKFTEEEVRKVSEVKGKIIV